MAKEKSELQLKAIELAKQGKTTREIREILGLDRKTAKNWTKYYIREESKSKGGRSGLSIKELESRNAKIVELFNSGKKVSEIARIINVSTSTVFTVLKPYRNENNIRYGNSGLSVADIKKLKAKAEEMYCQGLTDKEISQKLNLDFSTVNKWFKDKRRADRKAQAESKQYDIELVREIGTYYQRMSAEQVATYMEMDICEVETILKRYKITKGMM